MADEKRNREENEDLNKNLESDLDELDTAYLAACRETASHAADVLDWQRIPCTEDGQLRTVEAIHEDIWNAVKVCLTQAEPV